MCGRLIRIRGWFRLLRIDLGVVELYVVEWLSRFLMSGVGCR